MDPMNLIKVKQEDVQESLGHHHHHHHHHLHHYIISLSPAAIYVVDKGWERLPQTELYLVSVDASLTPAIE